MPSRRAVIVSSCEPCASARSKSRPLAPSARSALQPRQHLARLAASRAAAVVADHGRRHAVRLDQLQRLRVVARVISTSWPCASQQLDERPEDERVRARRHVDPDLHAATASSEASRANALDVALVPEREREQAPELAREVLAAGDVIVEHARDGRRLQEALAAEHVGRERLARERLAARRAARPPPGSRSRASGRARPRPAAAARPPCAAAASSRGRAPCAAPAARTRSSRRPCP